MIITLNDVHKSLGQIIIHRTISQSVSELAHLLHIHIPYGA